MKNISRLTHLALPLLALTLLSGASQLRCQPIPEAPACVSLDPNGYGDCEMAMGVVFTGRGCAYASGCGCGEDCAHFFDSMAACEAACGDQMFLQEGEQCGDDSQGRCAEGLACCYPCGIQGCDFVCTPACDEGEPACLDGCYLYP